MPTYESELTLHVEKLVNDGFGIAYHNKKTIFIPKTIPGDVINARITHKKRKVLFAKVTRIITPSTLRQTPACIHAATCGGCQYQDIPYSTQIKLKTDILQDSISHNLPALLDILKPVVPCKSTTYYRNKMEFAFGETIANTLTLGLKQHGHYDKIIPITNCQLLSAESNHILEKSKAFFEDKKLSVWNPRKQTGCLRHLGIRHSKAHDQYMINVIAATVEPIFNDFAQYIQAQHPNIRSVNLIHINEKAGQPTTTQAHNLSGTTHIYEKINKLEFAISPLSFFQTNSLQAGVLYDTVRQLCSLKPSQTLLDLYCGTGTIGLYTSQEKCKVIGIEENESAIHDARNNAIHNNISTATFHHGRVKNILKFEHIKADCIIVDPPRSGMAPKAIRRTCDIKAPEIIYVSCNPVTLLRDLAMFQEHGYSVKTLIPVDMFPHTYHLECVTKLTLH